MGGVGLAGDDRHGLADLIDGIAADEGLSGVVRLDIDGRVAVQRAYGLAHRGLGIPTTVDTQFAIASGSKGLTALTVMSLVETGELALNTTARTVLGDDLALIDGRVTVEHLLSHRSDIGDYLDEDEVADWNDYVMTVPVQDLATTEQFLRVLDGHPMKYEPGERFAYSNGGYVVLALLAERASGVPFHDLVDQRVCMPAGMTDTSFLRSDELPGRAARGYLEDKGFAHERVPSPGPRQWRRRHLHHRSRRPRPVGCVVRWADRVTETFALMVQPRSEVPEESMRYGLGMWLYDSTGAVSVHGFDAGVGFVSVRDPGRRFTYTVFSNKSRGAWPVSQRLGELVN